MTLNQKLIASVMIISMGMVAVNAGMEAYERHDIKVSCAKQVSVENWQIKAHITTSGEVSEDTIEKICEIIQTKVPSEAWNYLCNSGGKIVVVEDDDIKSYILENYNCEKASEVEEDIRGYCPYFKDIDGILQKVDVVIAADCLDSLEHEFYHALDYSHGYSSSKEFQEIYADAKDISQKVFDTQKAIEYYSGEATEFFAEMSVLYSHGELDGVHPKLEQYLSEVIG